MNKKEYIEASIGKLSKEDFFNNDLSTGVQQKLTGNEEDNLIIKGACALIRLTDSEKEFFSTLKEFK